MTDTKIFAVLLLYLTFASVGISYACGEYGISNIPKLGIIDWVETNSTSIDFSTINEWNKTGSVNKSGYYRMDSTYGIITTGMGLNKLMFKSTAAKTNETITNTYHIYNPNHLDYTIWYDYETFIPFLESPEGYMDVDSNGFYLQKTVFESHGYAYSNPQNIENVVIITQLNRDLRTIKITFNDLVIFDKTGAKTDNNLWHLEQYFAGFEVTGAGFCLVSLNAESITIPVGDTANNFDIFKFLEILGMLVIWFLPETIMPAWLNFVCIKIPAIVIFMIGVNIIRGR